MIDLGAYDQTAPGTKERSCLFRSFVIPKMLGSLMRYIFKIALLTTVVGNICSYAYAAGLEYGEITDKDREIFASLYDSDKDMYFVNMLLKDCKRRDAKYRMEKLPYSNSSNMITRNEVKLNGLTCKVSVRERLESKLTVNGKLIGWILTYADDFCIAPTITSLGAAFGNCVISGCLLNVPAGTRGTFVTPSRDIADVIYQSVTPPKAIKRLSADPYTVQDATGGCPAEP